MRNLVVVVLVGHMVETREVENSIGGGGRCDPSSADMCGWICATLGRGNTWNLEMVSVSEIRKKNRKNSLEARYSFMPR
jgi:hypothetical protein